MHWYSSVQAEFLSYCCSDIHSYKLIITVLTKFVINCRIFLPFFHKEWHVQRRIFCRHFESSRTRSYGKRVMICGIAFDRPDRLSRQRAFSYDRFKIHNIVPIVRIELNSFKRSRSCQTSGSFAIVYVAFPYDRPCRRNIFWDDWDDRGNLDDQMETRFKELPDWSLTNQDYEYRLLENF